MSDHGAATSAAVEPDQAAAWQEYLAAARRLDAVRRAAASAAGEQAESVQTAREELTGVRARLVPQQLRLRSLGVPEAALLPSPPEVTMATRDLAGGPRTVLTALRQARGAADAADVTVGVLSGTGPYGWPSVDGPWLRNLLVYGPFALAALIVQVVFSYVAPPHPSPVVALVAGLVLPVAAFGAGWLTVGLIFPGAPGQPVQRTPVLGVLLCLVPVVLGCALAGFFAMSG